ncbi:MAG TPA: condensation domain-containing protein, partial [Blastocatellia bacterium]|nr:condensation domain-containing protein [Blastocatellia bacterium]
GYLRRGDLTAERFVPDPLSGRSGGRLYRTGDLARYRADGNIEYLGRIDHQIKIRGMRIELGEIEAVMRQHGAVREAVVIAKQGAAGERQLVGYVVAERGRELGEGELRKYLGEILPDYMVPKAIQELKEMPLMPNGKIDFSALPAPDLNALRGSRYVAPRNEVENLLAAIWQGVLRVPSVGIHDDYFSLGGDSIRVIQIVHILRKYNFSITASDMLKNPTIGELAKCVVGGRASDDSKGIPLELIKLSDDVINSLPEGTEDAYPISRMQQHMLFHYSNDLQNAGVYHTQQSGHVYDESLSLDALRKALEFLVQKHPVLRTVFLTDGFDPALQAVKKRINFSLEEDDITDLDAAAQEDYIDAALVEDRRRLFDATKTDEPLFRFRVLLRSKTSAEFLMSMHHAITDGWGTVELVAELLELYVNIKNEAEPDASRPANVYKEFVALEQEILSSERAAEFWSNHLISHSHMPVRVRTRPSDEPEDAAYVRALSREAAESLYELTRDLRVSLKSVFLSVYIDLIAEMTRQDVITVGVVSNGRSERLSDPLNAQGMFWNMVPFCCRADFSDKLSQIKTVQALLVELEPYATYPLTKILEGRRKESLFFATFKFLHFHNTRPDSNGGGVRIIRSKSHDKFHFPLNYAVLVDPYDGRISLKADCDKTYFSAESNRATANKYVDLLEGISRARLTGDAIGFSSMTHHSV